MQQRNGTGIIKREMGGCRSQELVEQRSSQGTCTGTCTLSNLSCEADTAEPPIPALSDGAASTLESRDSDITASSEPIPSTQVPPSSGPSPVCTATLPCDLILSRRS